MTTRLLGIFTALMIMALAGLFLAIWRQRHPLHRGPFRWGILAWIMASLLGYMAAQKFGRAVAGTVAVFLPNAAESVQINFAAALIYAVIETSLVLWVVLKKPYREAHWEAAVCLGLGYGAAEAVTYGFIHLVFWVRPDLVPQPGRDVFLGMSGFAVIAPLVERLFSYLTHIYGALLIFYAVRFRIWKWLIMALVYKFLFYSLGALGWGLAGPEGLGGELQRLWVLELGIVALGGLGLAGVLHMGYLYHRAGDGPGLDDSSDGPMEPEVPAQKTEDPKAVPAKAGAKKQEAKEEKQDTAAEKPKPPPSPPPTPPPPGPKPASDASKEKTDADEPAKPA